ncbi:hypothetical protein F4678DRAFT_447693 [Xylaria arbuscula]|nr:hypothetical protein F4678DRAFT_447693 [Xylaria arbuscula]
MNRDSTQRSVENEGLVLVPQTSQNDETTLVSFDGLKRKTRQGSFESETETISNTLNIDAATAKRSKPDQQHEGFTKLARRLACPFTRRDCHSTSISKTCTRSDWDSVSRVKEHILRCHLPKYQCNRRREDFDSAIDLDSHQRNLNACVLQNTSPTDTITANQRDQLKKRIDKRVHNTDEEKWGFVYKILFPDDNSVPSPYRDEPCSACISKASLHLIRDYRQNQLGALVPLVEQELATIGRSHNMGDDLRAHIIELVSRLSVKLLDEFQEKHIASNEKDLATSSNHHGERPGNSTCEIPLSFGDLRDLNFDSTPDLTQEDYDFFLRKWE